MARMRTVKPSFFLNEDLAKLSPLHRLLFAGLWCIADREGRLYDKPATIKVQVLPFDEGDVDAMLADLSAGPDPWIIRYEAANGKRCIQVANFSKHQNPHLREAKSEIPAISGVKTQSPVKAVPSTVLAPVEPRKGDAEPGGFGYGSGSGSGYGNGSGSGGATTAAGLTALLDSIGLNTYQRDMWFKNAELVDDVLLVDRESAVDWIGRHHQADLENAYGRQIHVEWRGAALAVNS